MTDKSKRYLFVPPILIAVAVFMWLANHSREPVRKKTEEVARRLRTISAPRVDAVPRAIGYGTTLPTKVWRAVAEVSGRLVDVNTGLNSGAFLIKNEHVVTIDPQEYQLVVTRLIGEIAELEASLAELAAHEVNDGRSLEIEKASLALVQRDLDRVRDLIGRDAAAATELRDEERAVLSQKQQVQSLENRLNLLPSQRASIEASLCVRRAKLKQAEIDLSKTRITAPFPCRVGDVSVEIGQFVSAGELLFQADGTAATEIDVQAPIHHVRNLIRSETDQPLGSVPNLEMIRKLIHIDAVVRVTAGDFVAEWDARFDRVRERLDPETRTISMVVVVDQPYEKAIPGKRPPLFRDVFCEVELRGKPIPNRVVVPRSALRGGKLFVVDDQNRLRTRDIQVLFEQANFVVVAGGVEAGEQVIVSDPTPAIEGMLVDPEPDNELLAELIANANGQTSLR